LRIAYVITRADAVGGASIHVRDMARAMLERGHQAQVFVGGEGPVTAQLRAAGAPFHSLRHLKRNVSPLRDLQAVRELAAALRQYRPDIVSVHTAKAGWIGRLAARRLGLPAVYTPHGWPVGDRMPGLAGILFQNAEAVASRWAAAIVCVCEYERKLALRKRLAEAGRLRVIYNGVHDIAPVLRARPCCEPPRLISVARFERPKDHRTLLEAAALLRDREWRLELVGDGPLESEVRELAVNLGLRDRIDFRGYLADTAPALGAAQVFVLSSRSEGLPRSLLEAMRAGLPAVASEVGGVSEAVDGVTNGLLVPRGDAVALSRALAALVEEPALRARMGAAGRRRYEEQFRFERTAGETLSLYQQALSGKIA